MSSSSKNLMKRSLKNNLKLWSIPDKEEWLLSAAQSLSIIREFMTWVHPLFHKKKQLRILVPGVGYSRFGIELVQDFQKYPQFNYEVTLTDFDPSAVEYQKQLFEDKNIPKNQFRIVYDNILQTGLENNKFDLIIDSGLSDVFITSNIKSGKEVIKAFDKLLDNTGTIVSFSMFHESWKKMGLKKDGTMYGFQPGYLKRTSRRNTTSKIRRDTAILIHKKNTTQEGPDTLSFIEFQNLKDIHEDDMGIGAETY
jgi:hypothetical protein